MSTPLKGLLACISATEQTIPDLERAVVISGIGSAPMEDLRMALVRLRVMTTKSSCGRTPPRTRVIRKS